MKARALKKLLGDTRYDIQYRDDSICVGTSLCGDLISVARHTYKIKCAMDTWHKGRESLSNDKLIAIWDKLCELIKSGEIMDIMEGWDEIENKIPVFYADYDRNIICSYTDKLGYPNVTLDGDMMYENTHFSTEAECIRNTIKSAELSEENAIERLKEYQEKITQLQARIHKENKTIIQLNEDLTRLTFKEIDNETKT